jgi:hypothetical protein
MFLFVNVRCSIYALFFVELQLLFHYLIDNFTETENVKVNLLFFEVEEGNKTNIRQAWTFVICYSILSMNYDINLLLLLISNFTGKIHLTSRKTSPCHWKCFHVYSITYTFVVKCNLQWFTYHLPQSEKYWFLEYKKETKQVL